MSKNRTTGLRHGARALGVGAVAAVAMGLFSTGAAHADTFVPLPDGEKLGPGVKINRTHESALVSPSMAANGAGRTVWVSGNATADVSVTPEGEAGPNNGPTNEDGTNNSSTHGASQLNTGYIVGCQVSIGEDAIGLGGSLGLTLDGGSLGGSTSVELGPGEVKFVQIDYKDIEKPGVYSVEYQDVEMEIQGCAGYAQARAYTVVEIIGDHYSKTTLYGQPFSIG
ncbi:MspA family porin [Nocardia sp. NPDC058499]|uniref:MspA family porin n=1 Tax=Nocardia TaxID=1817 RepID=UPI0024564188|nr:MspA family porin [Nocardia carnea]